MNCNTGYLIIVAVLGITLWHPTETTSGEAFVEVVDGKCVYQNRTLEHHQSIQFESPCQAWFCNADFHKVYIGGCTPNPPLENCVEREVGEVMPLELGAEEFRIVPSMPILFAVMDGWQAH
ncbi:hypothetical protein MTO96_038243 [Rhipicephalus appendiculatus]